jgi:hypothetical protein
VKISQIIGYSEDALTYWAITSKLGEIMQTLGDRSLPSEAFVFYRPGFGRRDSIGPHAKKKRLSAEFGEFEVILGTQQAVYRIDSKWDGSSEIQWITCCP